MERDLFNPIKEYFEKKGYTCDGEVADIDLFAEKISADKAPGKKRKKDGHADGEQADGEPKNVVVELKVNLDFRSVQQAAQRQKMFETVYIGIFRPKDFSSRSFKDKLYILKRLGIGLIVVSKRSKEVQVVSEPVVSELSVYQRTNKKKAERVTAEFEKRRTKNNTGGVTGEKLITSYREDALLVLDALAELGGEEKNTKVRELSGINKASSILRYNYYGWFEKKEAGVYGITDAGYAALEEFEDTVYKLKRGGDSFGKH